MYDPIPMTELEAFECHCHPRFDVGRLEDQGSVFDHGFEIGVEILQHEVEVRLVREHVQKLHKDRQRGSASVGGR